MSLLMSSIAMVVCGVNIRTMKTIAAPMETSAWNSVWRWARSRSRSSAVISSSRAAVPAAAPATPAGASALTS